MLPLCLPYTDTYRRQADTWEKIEMTLTRKRKIAARRTYMYIRESVDSLCRDDADMPMPPYIRKAYNRPNTAFVSLFR